MFELYSFVLGEHKFDEWYSKQIYWKSNSVLGWFKNNLPKIIIKIKNSHTIIKRLYREFFMIVLNKKKIRLTILIVFVLVFGVAILKDNKESVPTVSLPVSGKTIVIDAGHR